MLPTKEYNYNLNTTHIIKNVVSNKKKDKYNFNIVQKSKFTFQLKLALSLKNIKKMNNNLVINIVKNDNNVFTIFKNYYLNHDNLLINDELLLDNDYYYLYISYSSSKINVSYELNYDIAKIIYINNSIQPIEQTNINFLQPKKYALIITISDYLYINDLQYCDEDAVSWCDFLITKNYEIILLGDKTSSYGKYNKTDLATEANIKKYMNEISTKVKSNDQFVFISSGHGSGDGKGNSFLCCLDEKFIPEGQYTDKELSFDIKKFVDKQVKTICFFDNCFSGGMLPEVVGDNPTLVCATSTCTDKGYGYDVSTYKNGAWTYVFLKQILINNPNLNINDVFTKALLIYPYKDNDLPQIGGNGSLYF